MFDGSDRYEPGYGSRSETGEEPEKGTIGLLEVSHTLYSEELPPEPENPDDCGTGWLETTIKCEAVERVSTIKETGCDQGLLSPERRPEILEEETSNENSKLVLILLKCFFIYFFYLSDCCASSNYGGLNIVNMTEELTKKLSNLSINNYI